MTTTTDDAMLAAAAALIGRTGCAQLQVRFSDDESPVVWLAVARYDLEPGERWETAAGLAPAQAVLRLCERLIDGGRCTHCDRPSAFTADVDDQPGSALLCWYQWDPELEVFRRGCEGDTT